MQPFKHSFKDMPRLKAAAAIYHLCFFLFGEPFS